jgi:cell fate (sporulation/competence/biofilm development) regulator YlbF (YheA/YmcA/DUF963 family)
MNPTETVQERARELGRMLGQSDEYKALERARTRLADDRAAVAALNRLSDLESRIARSLENGEEPTTTEREEYERVFSELQASPLYQGFVAAQSNFDRIVAKVNEEIVSGMETAGRSRIILPS